MEDLKKLLDSPSGKDLKEFLISELEQVKNIFNVKSYSKAQDQALAFGIQLGVAKELQRIFSKIMTFDNLKKIDSTKDDFASF